MNWIPLGIFLLLLGGCSYFRISLNRTLAIAVFVTFLYLVSSVVGAWATMIAFLITAVIGFVAVIPWRRQWISDPALSWFRKVLPRLSDTEREALEAGTVWWDAELFTGDPDWSRLLAVPRPRLRPDEQAFIDGPVEELCAMLHDWEIRRAGNLPPHVWQFLRDKKFFSMIIPPEYGGLGFSALGNSAVVMKIASRNLTAAVTVMVPNSLGPGELLLHYGTEEQKKYYLPRLADGTEIPCFALTSASAGSDAGAMPDEGIVCKGQWEGKEVLGLRLTWNKRYITLAPVATVVGLAFNAKDPDGLLGGEEELGITCALIPAETPGVETGRRHLPTGSVFMNGPTRGKDVFVPLDFVIGGKERMGQGWRMLMYSLAAGRAISLPALGTAGGKITAATSGAYARIRKQFKMPIAYFEGIEEPLARIAGQTYRMDAARLLTMSALALGEKPGVLSAILKYHLTEDNRKCLNDAMDIHAGKGIIQGPNNYLAAAYQAVPVAITVEGANILTRTLIIFGQGAIRCHPYLLKEMQAAQAEDSEKSRAAFDSALFSHVGFTISNFVRALALGITGARFVQVPVDGYTAKYYRQITRLSAAFSFASDIILLALGGAFKFREKISGRLADVLSHLYMASATLKAFEDRGRPKEERNLLDWALQDSLYKAQMNLINALRNFPIRWLGQLIKFIIFPTGNTFKEPSDSLGKHVARVLITDNPARERLIGDIYRSQEDDALGLVEKAFKAVLASYPAERALKNAFSEVVTYDNVDALVKRGLAEGVIGEEEAEQLRQAQDLTRKVVEVDDFPRSIIEPELINEDKPETTRSAASTAAKASGAAKKKAASKKTQSRKTSRKTGKKKSTTKKAASRKKTSA